MNLIKEIEIKEFDSEEIPLINVFDNNQSYLIFETYPPDNNKFSDYQINNLPQILTELTGVKVIQDDRELFIIYNNEDFIINKVVDFLKSL